VGNEGGHILHKELSYRIVGCAQRVHCVMGPGFPEAVYHKALCYEMADNKIPFETEKPVEVFYAGRLCGEYRLDLLVGERIVLELKALADLTGDHIAQAIAYLRATGLKLAILLNFGRGKLQMNRVVW